jgi:hypothetical protein
MVLVQCHDCGFRLLPEEEAVLQERWIPHSTSKDERDISLGAYSAFCAGLQEPWGLLPSYARQRGGGRRRTEEVICEG